MLSSEYFRRYTRLITMSYFYFRRNFENSFGTNEQQQAYTKAIIIQVSWR